MAIYRIEYEDCRITPIQPTRDGQGFVRVDGIKPAEISALFPEAEGDVRSGEVIAEFSASVAELTAGIDLDARLSQKQTVATVGQKAVYTVMVNRQIYGPEALFFKTGGFYPDADQEVYGLLRKNIVVKDDPSPKAE